jgi:hypothetical protein
MSASATCGSFRGNAFIIAVVMEALHDPRGQSYFLPENRAAAADKS